MKDKHMTPLSTATLDFTATFERAMADDGLTCSDPLIPDGHIHRYDVPGDRIGSKNGWYRLFDDENPTIVFGSWKTQQKITWSLKKPQDFSLLERQQYHQRITQAKQAADRVLQGLQQEAAVRAKTIWDESTPAPPDHPYLVQKQIQHHGVRASRAALVIPAYNESGIISTLQFIQESGEKKF